MIGVSEKERLAIREVLGHGRVYGYGNLISHLRTAWARELEQQGFPPDAAHGGEIMNYQMHDDIVQGGFWDETGRRYEKETV